MTETLLRLYLAHENTPPCPWLEIARIRRPGQLQDRLRERFLADVSKDRRSAAVSMVFYGCDYPAALDPPPTPDEWAAATSNLDDWLGFFALRFMSNANLYNSAKHGFALNTSDISVQLGDGEFLKQSGPSIEYLEAKRTGDRRCWFHSINWIDVDKNIVHIDIALRLMEDLWDLARRRYSGEKPPVKVGFDTAASFGKVSQLLVNEKQRDPETGVVRSIPTMSWQLLYYADSAPRG